MTEAPTLVDRLKHLMSDRLESGDEYSAEVAGRAANRINELEAMLEAIEGVPRFSVNLDGFWIRSAKGRWVEWADINAILRGEGEGE